jgi:hypothetical protein
VANCRSTLKQPTCAANSTHLHRSLPHAASIKLRNEQHEGRDTRPEAHAEWLHIAVVTDTFWVPQTDGWMDDCAAGLCQVTLSLQVTV